jgi:formate hydrogenlyase transcriptional activator
MPYLTLRSQSCDGTATTDDGVPPHATGSGAQGDPLTTKDPGSAAEPPAFDALLDRLSASLAQRPADAIDAHLGEAIGLAGQFFDVDHVALAQAAPDDATLRLTHRWARPGCAPLEPLDPETALPWIRACLSKGTPVCLGRLDELPPAAASDRAFLERLGVQSIASLPLLFGDPPVRWLMLSTVRQGRSWLPPVIDQLRQVAELLGSALARERAHKVLQRAIEFDQGVGGLAAGLLRVPVDAVDAQIEQTLGSVGELLGADRASVIQYFPDQRMVTRTHRWTRAGTEGPPVSDPEDAFPWLVARVIEAREIVALPRLDDLPPAAARDRATLARNGVVSGAIAPMVVEDRVVGLLMFATVTREQRWSPDLVARLRLVGEVIACALARRDVELALRTALSENERLRERLEAENVYLHTELVEARDFGEIVGRSPALQAVVEKVRQVADTTAPVLLLGETGTGKELLARALHAHGQRHARAFIAVNCAALAPTLIESELFGHEKGAFTGAHQAKPGRFELADQGTLFLDEIGELDPALQTKLLRVLEDGEIQRLGSTVTRKVDVRIIAATNRNLRRDLRDGRFRPDLYYRLSVFPIAVPPLRDRREDIPLLVWHFIESRQRALNRTITKIPKTVMAALQAYEWPGNVRELQNVIERAMILATGPVLHVEEALGPTTQEQEGGERRRSAESLRDIERAHIVQVLDRCGWTIEGRGQAAERLGVNPSTLRNRMRKLGIRRLPR